MFIFEYYRFIQFTAITLSRPRTYLKSQGWRANFGAVRGRARVGGVHSVHIGFTRHQPTPKYWLLRSIKYIYQTVAHICVYTERHIYQNGVIFIMLYLQSYLPVIFTFGWTVQIGKGRR